MRIAASLLMLGLLAAPTMARAADPCAVAPTLTAVSDLRFGRLIVDDRGGSAQLPAGACSIASTDGVLRLIDVETGCAEFLLDGGSSAANRLVQVRVQAPRSFSFGNGGGSAQVSRLSVSGTGVTGADQLYAVRLDAVGRSDLKLGAVLRIISFVPGEIAAPITISANYVGCPL